MSKEPAKLCATPGCNAQLTSRTKQAVYCYECKDKLAAKRRNANTAKRRKEKRDTPKGGENEQSGAKNT